VDGPLIGKAQFQAVSYRPSAELPDDDYPLVLSTGRTLYHYNVGTQTRRDAGPMARQPRNFIEMHRRDARKLGFSDGERVRVSSRRGEVEADVMISPRMRPGCVWMPFHFADQPTNRLTNDAGDVVTSTGEYKVCAVRVQPLEAGAPAGS
jgi:formate dehydrogenase major subunit/formate dehydrogenase alpha subunit